MFDISPMLNQPFGTFATAKNANEYKVSKEDIKDFIAGKRAKTGEKFTVLSKIKDALQDDNLTSWDNIENLFIEKAKKLNYYI